MMQRDKNKWIEDILNSMDGAVKASPPDLLFNKIEKKIALPFNKGKTISLSAFSAVAASLLLLVAVNAYFIFKKPIQQNRQQDSFQQLVQYYDITNDKDIRGL